MSVSTNGIIFYGWHLPDTDLPWIDHDPDDSKGMTQWWRDVGGYKRPFELYDEHGEYIGAPSEEKIAEYRNTEDVWDDEHPIPVEPVNVCSDTCPEWALAIPGTELTAYRGYPERFDLVTLAPSAEAISRARKFCKAHQIELPGDPHWYLAGFWGA